MTSDIATTPAPLLVIGPRGVEEVNQAACDELGSTAEQLLGDGFAASLRPESAAELEQVLEQAPQAGARPRRITVQRPVDGAADNFFELRIDGQATPPVTALVCDTTEQHRLDATIGALGNATLAVDSSSTLVWRPFGNARRWGVSDEDILGARVLEWVHPEDLPYLLERFAMLLREPGSRDSGLVRMRHPYIEGGWLKTKLTAVNCLKDPALRAVVVRSEDASPIDMVEDITSTTGQFRSLAEAAPVGLVVTDRFGAALYHNELARELLGIDYDVVGRVDWLSHLRSETADELERVFTRARQDLLEGTVVVSLDTAGSRTRWVRVDAMPQLDDAGNPFGLVATLLDVTSETEARVALSEARDRLWHMATHDPLTNLANRVLFRERLERALGERAGGNQGLALLYCDLNGFKAVNDRLGHGVGDLVLKIVAQRLAGCVRGSDLVGRYGGDEFLVLCRGFGDSSEVRILARRLVEAVEAPMLIDGEEVRIGMTLGVALANGSTRVDALISRADRNMYDSKVLGDKTS